MDLKTATHALEMDLKKATTPHLTSFHCVVIYRGTDFGPVKYVEVIHRGTFGPVMAQLYAGGGPDLTWSRRLSGRYLRPPYHLLRGDVEMVLLSVEKHVLVDLLPSAVSIQSPIEVWVACQVHLQRSKFKGHSSKQNTTYFYVAYFFMPTFFQHSHFS